MAAIAIPERCPHCGREWPSRFGSHNCNYHREYVHNNAIVVQPLTSIDDGVKALAYRLFDETCRSAENADLAGEEGPYRRVLGEIDSAIGFLKTFRRDMQELRDHRHEWQEDDYCAICHADGRA